LWLMNQFLVRSGQAVDFIVSTRGVLVAMSAIMAGLTVTTAANPKLAELPGQAFLVVCSAAAAVIGFAAAWTAPTSQDRGWMGMLWLLYFAVRGTALGYLTATETKGLGEFLLQSNPLLLNTVAAFFGLLVFARRKSDPYHRPSRET